MVRSRNFPAGAKHRMIGRTVASLTGNVITLESDDVLDLHLLVNGTRVTTRYLIVERGHVFDQLDTETDARDAYDGMRASMHAARRERPELVA